MLKRASLFLLLLGLTACTALPGTGTGDELPDLRGGKADNTLPLAAREIRSAALFDDLAFEQDGGGLVLGRSVKFLIDRRNPSQPQIYFMNAGFAGAPEVPAEASRYHFYFAQQVLPRFRDSGPVFNDVTYWAQDKRYVAGTVQLYRTSEAEAPLYGVQLYPQDVATGATITEVARIVSGSFQIEGARLGWVSTGPQQIADPEGIQRLHMESTTVDRILGSLTYLPMQLGEAYGILRMYPTDGNLLSAEDIPVFDELPLDLTVVAGTITRAIQDASSHINLKSKERGTPNMVLRDAGPSHAVLGPLADQPVHLVVGAAGWSVTPATLEEVREWQRRRPQLDWLTMPVASRREIVTFADMCPDDPSHCIELTDTFGAKASHLGLLTSPALLGRAADGVSLSAELQYDLVPPGFGVSNRYYVDFVEHNAALKQELDAFIADEMAGNLLTADRVTRIARIQSMFLAAELPPGMLEEFRAGIEAAMPGIDSIKIRSSANAEDRPGFDGAGLYNSFRADLDAVDDRPCRITDGGDKVKPRTISCAIKAVYASLWNKRAVEERSFARLDHASAAMGLAVVSRYEELGDVQSNSVVITRVLNTSGIYGYTFSSQTGNNVVTNPETGTVAENTIAAFILGEGNDAPTFITTRYAQPVAGQPALMSTVMTAEQMTLLWRIIRRIEEQYCLARDTYYDGDCAGVSTDPDKPRSLDLELKLFTDGRFLIKQVREFSGR